MAKRIGRSISTVRKMERCGSLNSRISGCGVHVFDAEDVERAAESVEWTGRALPCSDVAGAVAIDADEVAELRELLGQATRRVVELEQEARVVPIEHKRFRGLLVHAASEIVAIAKPRDRFMIDALECLLELLVADSSQQREGDV